MSDAAPANGLWSLVIVNSAIFIFFAYTFFKPQTMRDWRSFSASSAFLVALFAEMYGHAPASLHSQGADQNLRLRRGEGARSEQRRSGDRRKRKWSFCWALRAAARAHC